MCGIPLLGLGISPWACIKRKISYSSWRMTSSGDRHQGCDVQVQDGHLEDFMLEACNPFGDNGQVKMFLREALPSWCMGERYMNLHQAKRKSRKEVHLKRSRSTSSSSSGMRKGKGMILIGFLFFRSRGVSRRPGYRIDDVLSRGALK